MSNRCSNRNTIPTPGAPRCRLRWRPWQPGHPAKGQADEVFREKPWVYNNLYAMSPGASRESVLRSWLSYLKQSRATVSDRAQWFVPVNALIGRVALDPGNTKLAEI